ncbi:MAG: hydrogenase/urease maturation nickel metallochaperone HypA [Acidimicrobiales bacterium]|jgi:Zn finger protein HypA/HybF involved in hydrogenase expression
MHDYWAISSVIARLQRDPGPHDDVVEVRVKASPAFSREALQQTYEVLTLDTPLVGSRLVVEEVVDRRECAACKVTWAVSYDDVFGHLVACPSCGTLSPLEEGAGIELLEIRRAAI